ncbi:MAG: CPBP family intramembrane glutamic endopeptidase [Acidimicrobiales bacterium]
MTDLLERSSPEWPIGRDEVRWGVPSAVVCLLGAQAFAVVWAVMAVGAVYGSDPLPESSTRPIWTLLVFNVGLWIAYFAGPVLVKRITASGPLVDFDLRAGPAQIALSILIGIAAQLALLPALYWLVLRFMSGDPNSTAEELGDRVNNVGDALLFTVAVVVVAPIVEEWFYRGLLLPTLARRFGTAGGAVGSAAVFALVHQEVILLPGLFVLGLILAVLTIKTGRIGPAIVTHMAFNATTVVQLLLL